VAGASRPDSFRSRFRYVMYALAQGSAAAAGGDRAPGPLLERRAIDGSVDQDVRVEEDHGSRVVFLSDTQPPSTRKGAEVIAARQRARLVLGA